MYIIYLCTVCKYIYIYIYVTEYDGIFNFYLIGYKSLVSLVTKQGNLKTQPISLQRQYSNDSNTRIQNSNVAHFIFKCCTFYNKMLHILCSDVGCPGGLTRGIMREQLRAPHKPFNTTVL